MLDFITYCLIAAPIFIVWRMFVTPRLAARRAQQWRLNWPTNALEGLLIDDASANSFEHEFATSKLLVIGVPETSTPMIISANFDATLAESLSTSDGDLHAGPFVWCFTSQRRVAEFRETLLAGILKSGCFEMDGRSAMQFAMQSDAELMINPFLEYGCRYDRRELEQFLQK